MNEEMVKKYCPMLSYGNMPIGNPGDTGTGQLMGAGAGGALIHMNEHFITLPFYPPGNNTYGIFINSQGQRFINEDVYHARLAYNAIRQNSDRIYWVLILPAPVKALKNWQRISILTLHSSNTPLSFTTNMPPMVKTRYSIKAEPGSNPWNYR
jgi:hypothetical protein